jgi:hypothetical protein
MGLNETRNHRTPARIEYAGGFEGCALGVPANRCDSAISDEHVPADDAILRVARDYRPASNEQVHESRRVVDLNA